MKKKKKIILVIGFLFLLLLIAVILWLVFFSKDKKDVEENKEPENDDPTQVEITSKTITCTYQLDLQKLTIIMEEDEDGYIHEIDYLETLTYKNETDIHMQASQYSKDEFFDFKIDLQNLTITTTKKQQLLDLEGQPKPLERAEYVSALTNGGWTCK